MEKEKSENVPSDYVTLAQLQQRWKKQQDDRKQLKDELQEKDYPANYVTLAQLQQRWKQQKQKQKNIAEQQQEEDKKMQLEEESDDTARICFTDGGSGEENDAVMEGCLAGQNDAVEEVAERSESESSQLKEESKKGSSGIKKKKDYPKRNGKKKMMIEEGEVRAKAEEEKVKVREPHVRVITSLENRNWQRRQFNHYRPKNGSKQGAAKIDKTASEEGVVKTKASASEEGVMKIKANASEEGVANVKTRVEDLSIQEGDDRRMVNGSHIRTVNRRNFRNKGYNTGVNGRFPRVNGRYGGGNGGYGRFNDGFRRREGAMVWVKKADSVAHENGD